MGTYNSKQPDIVNLILPDVCSKPNPTNEKERNKEY